jgi:predicted enzyme related to lactoylglutathione lyase
MTKFRTGLVLDCDDPEALAPFWAAALEYKVIGGAGNYWMVAPEEEGSGPQLLLQKVPEAKGGKNRMHIDIHVPDIDAEAARLEGLGAKRLETGPARAEFDSHWHLMADPEGNEFCVCDGGGDGC